MLLCQQPSIYLLPSCTTSIFLNKMWCRSFLLKVEHPIFILYECVWQFCPLARSIYTLYMLSLTFDLQLLTCCDIAECPRQHCLVLYVLRVILCDLHSSSRWVIQTVYCMNHWLIYVVKQSVNVCMWMRVRSVYCCVIFSLIAGFVSRQQAEDRLLSEPFHDNFILRFSDSEVGGLTTAYSMVNPNTGMPCDISTDKYMYCSRGLISTCLSLWLVAHVTNAVILYKADYHVRFWSRRLC